MPQYQRIRHKPGSQRVEHPRTCSVPQATLDAMAAERAWRVEEYAAQVAAGKRIEFIYRSENIS